MLHHGHFASSSSAGSECRSAGEAALELQEKWQANQARLAYNAAMTKFKRSPPKIIKNKHVKLDDTEYSRRRTAGPRYVSQPD